jgi:hypothetical protein
MLEKIFDYAKQLNFNANQVVLFQASDTGMTAIVCNTSFLFHRIEPTDIFMDIPELPFSDLNEECIGICVNKYGQVFRVRETEIGLTPMDERL